MNVHELNADQMLELKQDYLCEKNDRAGIGTSYGELADADELVSDEEIVAEYSGYDFGNDDFFCTAGMED